MGYTGTDQENNDEESPDEFPTISDFPTFLRNAKVDFDRRFMNKVQYKVTLSDFKKIRTLGSGSFGRVQLVKCSNGKYYAMKVLIKADIVKKKQVQHTVNEKRVLASVRFPFLIHMKYCFQDNSFIYFTLPYIPGGEMFHHLRKMVKFDETLAKFYAAQVVMALEYLHYLDLVHRDIKPENILVGKDGYLKVVDMGFCKIVTTRTYTMCGTPEYIAPEIILSMGYGKSVDWWSFGVLLYEMTAGFPPFFGDTTMKTFERITAGKFRMLSHFGADLKDMLHNLLQVDLTRRYGNLRNGVSDIKEHKWLKRTKWMDLLNKKTKPPYVPTVKSERDTSNFTRYPETELKVDPVDKYAKEFDQF